MNPAQLLAHFDRLSEAPDALPRLRRFILDLAVRGKLVEQDPNDEPASELIKRILAEKERLVKSGEIRKEKTLAPMNSDELPFNIPKGWEWALIRQITSDRGQSVPNKDFTYIDVTAINKEAGCITDAKIIAATDAPSRARKLVRAGDVLYSCVRPYLLNIAVVESEIFPEPIASTAFAVLNGFGLVHSKYLWIALRSPFMVECVEAKMRGQAYPAINDSDFAILPFPLPPLAEQHRIVAKVDELMALCDQLEAAKTQREQSRERLVAASLQRLNQPAEDAAAFREDARFTFNHLPRLTTRPAHIKQLRQTILNLAVRGKLVEQDPNDEPASELIKRIRAEKAQLVKERKLRKQDELPPIKEREQAFSAPISWSWERLGNISRKIHYGYTASANQLIQNVRLLRITDIQDNSVDWSSVPGCDISEGDIPQYKLECSDILIARTGGTIGKTFLVEQMPVIAVFASYLIRVQGTSELYDRYLKMFMESPVYWTQLQDGARGAGQPNVNGQTLGQMSVPIPPLAEQHRIVAKVDELMALCDQLETQLTATAADSRRLLEAVLHEALKPAQKLAA
jgi:type I restriction enzyme S subunit